MALVPCVTNANPSLSLLGGGGGGGGGGGAVSSTNQFFVSSITGENSEPVVFTNGAAMSTGASITFNGGATFPIGDIAFTNSNGQITGVSTINGAPYGAASVAPSISTTTTSGGYFGSAPVNLNAAPATVVPNQWYTAQLEIKDIAFVSQPNATECFNISIADQSNYSYLGTFNCAQLSTNKGVNNSRGFCVSGPFEALGTAANFVYTPSSNVSASTFIVTGGIGWLTPLGA